MSVSSGFQGRSAFGSPGATTFIPYKPKTVVRQKPTPVATSQPEPLGRLGDRPQDPATTAATVDGSKAERHESLAPASGPGSPPKRGSPVQCDDPAARPVDGPVVHSTSEDVSALWHFGDAEDTVTLQEPLATDHAHDSGVRASDWGTVHCADRAVHCDRPQKDSETEVNVDPSPQPPTASVTVASGGVGHAVGTVSRNDVLADEAAHLHESSLFPRHPASTASCAWLEEWPPFSHQPGTPEPPPGDDVAVENDRLRGSCGPTFAGKPRSPSGRSGEVAQARAEACSSAVPTWRSSLGDDEGVEGLTPDLRGGVRCLDVDRRPGSPVVPSCTPAASNSSPRAWLGQVLSGNDEPGSHSSQIAPHPRCQDSDCAAAAPAGTPSVPVSCLCASLSPFGDLGACGNDHLSSVPRVGVPAPWEPISRNPPLESLPARDGDWTTGQGADGGLASVPDAVTKAVRGGGRGLQHVQKRARSRSWNSTVDGDGTGELSRVTLRAVASSKTFVAAVVALREGMPFQPLVWCGAISRRYSKTTEAVQDLAVEQLLPGTWLLTGFLSDAPSLSLHGDLPTCTQQSCGSVRLSRPAPASARKRRRGWGSEHGSPDRAGNGPSDGESDGASGVSAATVYPKSRKHRKWTSLEDERLLAWAAEGKEWPWIHERFPNRTPGSVKTHWYTLRDRRHGSR